MLPIEYALILLFVVPACIVSFAFGIYDSISNLCASSTNLKANKRTHKDNLESNKFNLSFKKQQNNQILSIIIPCYNESIHIQSTLLNLDRRCFDHEQIEIIVVDGNSPDVDELQKEIAEVKSTLQVDSSQISVVTKQNVSGRGSCQNVGVAHSKGSLLLFVHADTVLPRGYDLIIRNSLKSKETLLGAFSFAVDRSLMRLPVPGIAWVEFFAGLRNKMLSLPYGDQSLWMNRSDFIDVGGFEWIPILEDIEFVNRCRDIARNEHRKILILSEFAYCSPRRWEKNGVAKNTVWNQWMLFLYTRMKYTPARIYQIYYGRKPN